ncbi:MAG: CaiB/BaiF CoA-transferase family protein [Pseudomonadota bacterium]|nr:CaiB/BaiF CoA-transferase family protein [Pseudomonadota bacterium]
MPEITLPLGRFKVLDLTRVRAGPTCVRQLADWGADCIKIELPPSANIKEGITGDRNGADFQNLHRNKRSMTLNLKTATGREIFYKLAAKADVIVENFRPDVKNRLGVDYNSLRQINNRIILGSISGFGQDGPYKDRPGVDQIAQGLGGVMSVTGLPGQGPVRVGTAIADLSAGLYCAIGILIALLEREASGEGQWVHTSLLESQVSMLDFQAARWLIGGEVPPQAGNNHPTSIPTGVYPCSDGDINIAAGGQAMFERLCKALKAIEMEENPNYATADLRRDNRDKLNAEIATYTRRKPIAEWIELLNVHGVPCGPINTIDKMFEDPQVKHLGLAAPVLSPSHGEINLVGQAVNMSRATRSIRSATPALGEHTDDILLELGYGPIEIEKLYADTVV